MPTGYTLELYDGKDITFEEFVLKCARAFGALINMRDEPRDAPIPERFEPSYYHLKELIKAKSGQKKLKNGMKKQRKKKQNELIMKS